MGAASLASVVPLLFSAQARKACQTCHAKIARLVQQSIAVNLEDNRSPQNEESTADRGQLRNEVS